MEFSLLACDWWLASIPTSLLKIFSRLSKLNRFFKKLFGIFELAEIIQDTVTWTENLKSPRIIKTHLPLSMLPPSLLETSKVLYVGRYKLIYSYPQTPFILTKITLVQINLTANIFESGPMQTP